jgi:hypothetical protein
LVRFDFCDTNSEPRTYFILAFASTQLHVIQYNTTKKLSQLTSQLFQRQTTTVVFLKHNDQYIKTIHQYTEYHITKHAMNYKIYANIDSLQQIQRTPCAIKLPISKHNAISEWLDVNYWHLFKNQQVTSLLLKTLSIIQI